MTLPWISLLTIFYNIDIVNMTVDDLEQKRVLRRPFFVMKKAVCSCGDIPDEGDGMRFTSRSVDPLFDSLEPVVRGLGMSLVELTLSRHKNSVQVRAAVYKRGSMGVDDCARAHRAMLPRLELAFPGQDLYVEVSSPGVERLIKDGAEFAHYIGRGIKCYRTDISDWSGGILESADENVLSLKGKEGMVTLRYEIIAKAKLDYSQEV
jgi:ribosome maturation factor RimP